MKRHCRGKSSIIGNHFDKNDIVNELKRIHAQANVKNGNATPSQLDSSAGKHGETESEKGIIRNKSVKVD